MTVNHQGDVFKEKKKAGIESEGEANSYRSGSTRGTRASVAGSERARYKTSGEPREID